MSRATRGCGCAVAVLLLLIAVGAVAFWKVGLPWLRSRPPAPSGGELQVHVLDVGPIDGDSILIISPTGKTVLIDAGEKGKGKLVLDALARYKVDHLDYFIATNPHSDHIGGVPEVFKGVKVATVIDNGVDLSTPQPAPTKAGTRGTTPRPAPPTKPGKSPTSFFDNYEAAIKESGATYEKAQPVEKAPPGEKAQPGKYDLGGGVILTVLAPTDPFFTKEQMKAGGNDTNANSIVLRLDYGQFSMLLMGDAEAQTEERMLRQDPELKARLVKVGHHGSKYATSAEFLKQVHPEVAIISDGAWNRYGHPDQGVLDRLKAAGARVYRTDLQGEISITTTGKQKGDSLYEIKTAKEAAAADLWTGREGQKDDSSRSGFIAYGDFGPPPKQKKTK